MFGVGGLWWVLLCPIWLESHTAHQTRFSRRARTRGDLSERLELSTVLINKNMFQDFIDYTIREFTHESLVFEIEMFQYKSAVRKLLPAEQVEQLPRLKLIGLYDGFPVAQVLKEVNDKNDVVACAMYLFMKYVVVGVDLELNLSSGCRRELYAIFAHAGVRRGAVEGASFGLDLTELEGVFDDALTEIGHFVNTSLSSFERTMGG